MKYELVEQGWESIEGHDSPHEALPWVLALVSDKYTT